MRLLARRPSRPWGPFTCFVGLLLAGCSGEGDPRIERPEVPEGPAVSVSATPVPDDPTPTVTPPVTARPPRVTETSTCQFPPSRPEGLTIQEGLPFSGTGSAELLLDLYTPASTLAGPRPLVVLIHGGGWRTGRRDHLASEGRRLAHAGFAAASIDYRVGPGTFPASVSDLRCAVRFLRQRSTVHHIDPDRIALVGFSAGGHLAALQAYGADNDALDDGTCALTGPSHVSALVAFFSPFDLTRAGQWPAVTARVIETYLGESIDGERAAMASPLGYVTRTGAQNVPALLIHGARDEVVHIAQSRQMVSALGSWGTLVEIPQLDHGFLPFTDRPHHQVAGCTLMSFLSEALSRSPAVE